MDRRAEIHYFFRAVGLIRRAAPAWIGCWLVILGLRGCIPVLTVHLVRDLVDRLADSVRRQGFDDRLLLPVALLAGLMVLGELTRAVETWVRTRLSDRVSDHITELVHDRALAVELAFYESSDYHDRLFRVRGDAAARPLALLESLGALTQGGITLCGLALLLLRFGVWLPLLLVVSTVPGVWIMVAHSLRANTWRLASTERERKASYYDSLVCSGGTAAEVRVFGVGAFFRDAFRTLREGLRAERMALLRAQLRREFALAVVGHSIAAGAVGLMAVRTIRGQVTLGELALFYQAFNQGQGVLRSVADHLRGVYSNSLFLADLFEFLDLKSGFVDPSGPIEAPSRVCRGLSLDGVCFRYPQSDAYVLDNLTLTFPAGSITAIVGPNGAGKSTLLKVLCRLYEPTSGKVAVDGVDIRRFRLRDYRRLVTTLFQVPVCYAASVRTNIQVGDIERGDSLQDTQAAARAAGADDFIGRLPAGYETPLIKGAGGIADLSVGEWQRLALARAFLRRAEIIILDEPTSAMDPWAEADWLDRFRNLTTDKTVIIITHRFTTAMKADVIHVMERGRIVESGSHDELVSLGRRYAASWTEQVRTWGSEATSGASGDNDCLRLIPVEPR